MIRSILYSLLFFSFLSPLAAQSSYFQQEVDYVIDVTLNDKEHLLSGSIAMTYTNHSPNALDKIYIHLWGNAFKNRKTAFVNQKIRQGDTQIYFADDKALGGYSNLDFKVNDKSIRWEYDAQHPDICLLILPQSLKSGESIQIKTPFQLKIPASFSRLGHVGESYQMTQWYPKPAVYDQNGWHQMPYLDMGEFYSEFGKYDVTITLPENYVVAATGILQTESEKTFL